MSSRKVKFGAEEQPEAHDQAWWGRGVRPADLGTLGGLTLYRCHDQQRQSGDYNILFSQKAYRDVVRHLKADTTREHGGLLLGYATGTAGPAIPTVFVTHALPAKHTAGTPTSLTFTNETWAEWDMVAEEFHRLGIDLQRVGWYHSHPNIEIFLSRYDLDVCTTFDRLKCPVALVVDPIRDRGGFFICGRDGYQPHSPKGFWEIHAEKEAGVAWCNVDRVEFEEPGEGQAHSQEPHTEAQSVAAVTHETADDGDNAPAVMHPPSGSRGEMQLEDSGKHNRRWPLTAALLVITVLSLAAVAGILGLLAANMREQQTQITRLEGTLNRLHEQLATINSGLGTPPLSGKTPAESGAITHDGTSPPPKEPTKDKKGADDKKKQGTEQTPTKKEPSDKKKGPDGAGAQTSTPVEVKPVSGTPSPEQKKDPEDQAKPDKQEKKQGMVPPELR